MPRKSTLAPEEAPSFADLGLATASGQMVRCLVNTRKETHYDVRDVLVAAYTTPEKHVYKSNVRRAITLLNKHCKQLASLHTPTLSACKYVRWRGTSKTSKNRLVAPPKTVSVLLQAIAEKNPTHHMLAFVVAWCANEALSRDGE